MPDFIIELQHLIFVIRRADETLTVAFSVADGIVHVLNEYGEHIDLTEEETEEIHERCP